MRSSNICPGLIVLIFAAFLPLKGLVAQDNSQQFTIDWYGYMGGDLRYFHDDALYEGQEEIYYSAVFKPQLYVESRNSNHEIHFMGYARLDQYDEERTHADIRDLYWRYSKDKWEINAGIKTITWGKVESTNLVDIVNQYDLVEGRTLEHKLGQPLVQFTYAPSWVTLELLAMTYSRELQFPGQNGRLQPGFQVHFNKPLYELNEGKYIPDFAFRISKSTSNMDIGVSSFYGTGRLPIFINDEHSRLVPFYEEVFQNGIELQWLTGAFAWKVEAINQYSKRRTIQAITIGTEYNTYFISGPEIKWMLEYTFDERRKEQINGINNDLFAGINLNMNDIQGTNLLIAGFYDLDYNSIVFRSQFEKRIGNSWKIGLLYNGIYNTDPEDFYHLLRNDSHFEFVMYHFF